MKELYTLTEAAQILKVSRSTVYNHLHAGKLHARKAGNQWRFTAEDLEEYLAAEGRQGSFKAEQRKENK